MIYSYLLKLRESIITYTGDTFTGKGERSSKNLIRHLSFMHEAKIWGPTYVTNIIRKAEKYFDFTGPPGGIYDDWYLEASEEISLNCIKIMEAYIDGYRSMYKNANTDEHERNRLRNHIAVSCNLLMKFKRLRMSDNTTQLYLNTLSTVFQTELSSTGNNDIYRKYEKQYEHYKPYVPHPLLERRRSTKK